MSSNVVRAGRLALIVLAAVAAGGLRAAPNAELWAVWREAAADDAGMRLEHGEWQTLLDRYLLATEDGRTVFAYDAVTPADRQRLERYLARLASIDPRKLARAEQLPYWINLYNALTVSVVLDHPDAPSIRRMGGGWFGAGPWDDELLEIAGHAVTLNDIEHRILRPIWQDHRIHYALNCASVGCPNLAPRAYTRANAQRLLEAGEDAYLDHPRGVAFTEEGTLRLSSLFDWYLEDFGGSRAALLDYLAGERPGLAQRLTDYQGEIEFHYDWSLNDAE
ncbi:MAG: DUF547 domain-containing protein [Pseudomonadota bacterium]